MNSDLVCMYCEHKGSIFIFLNRSLQESLLLEFVMIVIIFFFNSEYFNAGCWIASKNYTISYNGMYVKKIYHSEISWDSIDLTDLIAKQTEFNFVIIRSIWYYQHKTSSKLCVSGVRDAMVIIADINVTIKIPCSKL